jgi:type IV secretion system protein VirD4
MAMNGGQRVAIVAPTFAIAALAGMMVASQRMAALFHYPVEFGASAGHLYAPWAIFGWAHRYGHQYPADFLTSLGMGAVVFAIPAMIAVAIIRHSEGGVREFGKKAWATVVDVREAKLFQPKDAFGRVFGRFAGKDLIYTGIEHAIIVGATRTGKGAGHVVPTLLNWAQSALIYDRKGELWEITADYRKTFSHVIRFQPTSMDTARYNPLFEVRKGPREIADIQNVVGVMIDPLGAKGGDLDFFEQNAAGLFTALIVHVLYAAKPEQKTIAHVRALLLDIDPTLIAMQTTLHRKAAGGQGMEVHPECRMVATALRVMSPNTRSSIVATAQKALTLWADPLVQNATSWSDFSIGDLVCSKAPVSLYLTTPQSDADRLSPLIRIILRQAIDRLMEDIHVDGRGRAKTHRLLLMLDEFPKLGKVEFLSRALGEMAGYGLTSHLICQSFNDVTEQYGPYTTLFDNMHITVAFATSEPANIKKVVERAGKALEMRESYTSPRGLFGSGRHSTNTGEQQRYVLNENDVRALDDRQQFIFVGGRKPIRADKLRYFETPWLAARAGDYFHGVPAKYVQKAGKIDRPRAPTIDWLTTDAVLPEIIPTAPASTTTTTGPLRRDMPKIVADKPRDIGDFGQDPYER